MYMKELETGSKKGKAWNRNKKDLQIGTWKKELETGTQKERSWNRYKKERAWYRYKKKEKLETGTKNEDLQRGTWKTELETCTKKELETGTTKERSWNRYKKERVCNVYKIERDQQFRPYNHIQIPKRMKKEKNTLVKKVEQRVQDPDIKGN